MSCQPDEELLVTDKLLEERNRVMEAIPPCPCHGSQYVPHAIEWVEFHKRQDEPSLYRACDSLKVERVEAHRKQDEEKAGDWVNFIAACSICQGTDKLILVPHRDKWDRGLILGYVYICAHCAPTYRGVAADLTPIRRGAP